MLFLTSPSSRVKRIEEAERRLPDFLRDLAGHTNFGTPMSEAILRSAENKYGPLSIERRKSLLDGLVKNNITDYTNITRIINIYYKDPETAMKMASGI